MASQGPNNPGTLADDSGTGTTAWSNPTNAASSNDSYATATSGGSTTHYLKATNFGLPIPAGATINGITVEIERSESAGQVAEDNRVRLVKAGTIQTPDKSTGILFPFGTDAYQSYGGAADVWSGTWTADDINDYG